MLGAGQKRPGDAGAEGGLAAHGGGPEARAVERVPEGQGLEASSRGAGKLEGDLDGVGAAGGEEHLSQAARREFGEGLRELHRRLAGEAAGGKAQIVELGLDRRLQSRMPVADVVDAVAVEIHVAAPGQVLDPYPFRLRDRGDAGT